ncbi:MAG TPA: SMP-30/gluconolactonase/LRE family protein [Pyrinomonadaceae bacterium]|nr:SMP-30/gluconolactonase/LRE family protein [Pyrinomonadaceae bacterium]
MSHIKSFRTALAAVVCISACLAVLAQEGQKHDARYYETLAVKAYQAKDYAAFLENMKQAAALRPDHPRIVYNLSAAYALNGRKGEAIDRLTRLARMGLAYAAERDDDFASIKDSREFANVIALFRNNRSPVGVASQAFTVHEKGLVPESVAYDPSTRSFYVSSVYRRKILRVTSKGDAEEFADERDGLWSVMGMKVDAARRELWVCTAAQPQMSNYVAAERGRSGVFKFDLRTGKLAGKYMLPDDSKQHWLGDLVVSSRGDVYATDSLSPALYVLRRGADRFETVLEGEPFASPQGLDFSADEKRLFVADYAKGVFVFDLETKKYAPLAPAPDSTMLGIDGLYFYRGRLVAVQNGVNPNRVVQLFLSKDLSRVERFETVAANQPVFDEPTLGVVVKDDFYFIANSQWGTIDEQGKLAPPEKLKEPVVLKLKL